MGEVAPARPGSLGSSLRDELARYFQDHRKLIEAEALTLLLTLPEPVLFSRRVIEAAGSGQPFITRAMVEELLRAPAKASSVARAALELPLPGTEPEPPPAYALVAEGFSPLTEGRHPLAAYGALFESRFRQLQRLLRGRPDLPDLTPIRELRKQEGPVSLIAMLRRVRQTSERKHLLLEVEDETGATELLLPRDRPSARGSYIPDEVLGIRVELGKDPRRMPVAVQVVRPEVPAQRTPRRAPDHRRVLFLSDLHIGSKSFLSESWEALIAFLRGEGPSPEVAREIAHVVVAGDLVDGIGIYPNQERDLALHDIFAQYEELGRRLRELPERLNVVVLPGNHDAVCPAEPQPALSEEVRGLLPANVRAVGNPSTCALDGVIVEAYHGRSFDDLIPAIPGASYARPTEVMKTMLAMRHLAPIYGGRTPLAPLSRDGLVIDPVPDILVTGHAHTYGVDQYRGILLLNASAWQAETAYQKMRNITAVPGRAAVVSLADRSIESFDFSKPRPEPFVAAP